MRKALISLLLAFTPLLADDDRFRELYADPSTRGAALAEIIPGSQHAYFHIALDHQLAGRAEEFRDVMAEWKAASERKQNRVSNKGMAQLENRQLLLDYEKNPEASLAELIKRLDLKFDQTRPDAAAAAASLPTRLDPALISEEAFEKATATSHKENPYTRYSDQRLLRELERVETFDEAKIRWFLENLKRADLPGVVPLIDRSLALERPVRFGSVPLHQKLTSGQLESLLALHPALRSNEDFAISYLAKLKPGAETDFERDPAAHAAHLSRCRDLALTLPPALNSLKAHVLFHHLRLQKEIGNFPLDDFLTFLALPRPQHPLLIVAESAKLDPLTLDTDYKKATDCPPVRVDLTLIISYLNHFLARTDSPAAFLPFIPEKNLAQLHARARLLAGENASRWASALDPGEFKSLQEETRIAFAPGAPLLLDSDASAALTLDLKNTPDLFIRIYELDLPAHLSRTGSEPDVSVDLDGLVPHHERRLTFTQAPLVQYRPTIPLPELAGPGAWLIDIVSGQVSARALIRKGSLIPYVERNATGQVVRVFDEKGSPVPTASISLGREKFQADASGRITIPNTSNQPVTRGIVQAGNLAAPVSLGSRSDEIALDAEFHLDREQLLADQQAKLHLRVRLTNHGHEIPLDRIREPALVLKAELLGGGTTERVIAENLTLTPLLEVPFQVPADLLKLTLTLRGTVLPATGGDPLKLSADATYQINADLKTARVATAFFSPTAEGHRLEVRGRNGEPLASRAITLECNRFDYKQDVEIQVRTDENGRVDLGDLSTIDYLTANGTDIAETLYGPKPRQLNYTSLVQVPLGQEIRQPLETPAAAPDRLKISLLETRDDTPVRDHFDKIAIEENELVIRGLPAGDFTLIQGDESTRIHISSGKLLDNLLVSRGRILAMHQPRNPVIATALADEGELKVQLHNFGPDTRVSIVAKRYQHDDWNSGDALYPFTPKIPHTLSPGFIGNGYLTERRLSDETRYILDRRAALKFPGVMLPRPSQLLNRWTNEDLEQSSVSGASGTGGTFGEPSERQSRQRDERAGSHRKGSSSELSTVCDFLGMPAVVRVDLIPDANGQIRLPLADFEGSQFIDIVATDLFSSDEIQVPLPASETPLRDRRIARPLDPQGHFLATRSAAVLTKEAVATIDNLLDADWRAFTTLTEAHQFLYGMSGDDALREFVFLTEWPDLSDEKKLDLLSKHACHELHLFLARKDRPFFDRYIKHLLLEKPEPQFMDDLLLQRDLTKYLRPYAWQRLNAAEKALLAQAMPAARERISRELSLRWELEAPAPDAETALFTQTLRGSDLALEDSLGLARNRINDLDFEGVERIIAKLRNIIIPRVDFEDTTLEEAVDFLRGKAMELDTMESDPAKKGVKMVIRRPRTSSPGAFGGGDPGTLKIRELRLRNVPLAVALKYICGNTKIRYKVDEFGVILVPQTETGEDIFTRTFRVPPDFASALDVSDEQNADPFAEPSASKGTALAARPPIADLLRQAGIVLPEGSSATLSSNGTLLVTGTPSELDKVEQLTQAVASSSPPGTPKPIDGFASGPDFDAEVVLNRSDVDPFAAPAGGGAARLAARPPAQPLFPERTRLWREANYYKNTKPTDETLIPLNRFWLDLAAWNGEGPFLSPHFNACHTSANAALMCLALLDLPFKAERPEVKVEGSTLRVKAREPMLLFYKDTRATDKLAAESPLLVRQSFNPYQESFQTKNGRQVENVVTGDFRPGVAYRASLVVTNPTGAGRRIDVLAQIPAGAIPLAAKPPTLSSTHEIDPYGVLMLDLAFYFPAAGEFSVYPMHVSEDGVVLAHTGPRVLRVSNEPAPQDAASWGVLAKEGSNEELLERLRTENLQTLDLFAIRWRLKDRGFFTAVSGVLRERLHFSEAVASFGFLHNDVETLRTYLENSQAVYQLGQWLDSPLLEIRPRVHHAWESLDFDPLVNPRAHRFGSESRLTHEAAREHYHAFLDQLRWKPALDSSDHLTLAAFLFLQDRIAEALARFQKIDPATLPGRIHYDYLHAVALFYQSKPGEARAIAANNLMALSPGAWQDRFQAVIDQADEIAAAAVPVEDANPEDETAAPDLALALAADGRLLIQHAALDAASLKLFSVDLEVLFSKDPFLKGGGSALPAIRANEIMEVPLAMNQRETSVELPEIFRKGNVLVSAASGTRELLKILDSRALGLRHLPLERTIQVFDPATSLPLQKTYIKVYAETRSGKVEFHKDGYTDLRGKFDYISHTGVDVSSISRFAILISDPEKGARTVIYER